MSAPHPGTAVTLIFVWIFPVVPDPSIVSVSADLSTLLRFVSMLLKHVFCWWTVSPASNEQMHYHTWARLSRTTVPTSGVLHYFGCSVHVSCERIWLHMSRNRREAHTLRQWHLNYMIYYTNLLHDRQWHLYYRSSYSEVLMKTIQGIVLPTRYHVHT